LDFNSFPAFFDFCPAHVGYAGPSPQKIEKNKKTKKQKNKKIRKNKEIKNVYA